MIKECPIILNNECVTVVKYGNTDIQFPSININTDKVYVLFENGNYSIVDKDYEIKKEEKPTKKVKKETTKESTKEKVENETFKKD